MAIAMNVPLRAPASAPRRSWPVLLVQLAIVLVVAAVAAATFVLSYAGVHAIALQSSVPTELARVYPAIFDAVLVIACLAVPALREARWWARGYTWLVILLIVAVLGAMDAVHAMNVALPRRDTAGVIAVLPWVLLLLAFSLWLAVLRHFRAQQSRPAGWSAGDALGAGDAAEPSASIAPLALPAPAAAAAVVAGPSEAAPSEAAPAAEAAELAAAPEVPAPAAAPEPAGAAPEPTAAASESAGAASESAGAGKAAAPDVAAAAEEAATPGQAAATPGQAPADSPQPTRPDLPALPAAGPSVGPSARPSVGPAAGPLVGPSAGPSVGPSARPSVGPSAGSPAGSSAAQEPDFAEESPLEALLNGRSADAEERSDDDASVPGITYSMGPRLRRVRSLPAPPVADE